MDFKAAPFRSSLVAYDQQAESLLAAHRAADPAAIDLFHRKHPRFLDDKIRWRPKFIPLQKSATPPFRSTMPASQSPAATTSLTGPRSPPMSPLSQSKAASSNSNPLSKPWSMATSLR